MPLMVVEFVAAAACGVVPVWSGRLRVALRVRVDDLQESEPGRGFDELVAFDAVEMAVEPCHALVCGCGGVFLERVPAGVAFGLFGGASGFLFGVGGLVTAGPEVDLLRDRVDGYGGWVLFADLLDGFFGGAGGREHAAGGSAIPGRCRAFRGRG